LPLPFPGAVSSGLGELELVAGGASTDAVDFEEASTPRSLA